MSNNCDAIAEILINCRTAFELIGRYMPSVKPNRIVTLFLAGSQNAQSFCCFRTAMAYRFTLATKLDGCNAVDFSHAFKPVDNLCLEYSYSVRWPLVRPTGEEITQLPGCGLRLLTHL